VSQAEELFPAFPEGFPAALVAGRAVSLRLFIPGAPVAKERPKAKVITPKGRRPFPQFYTPEATVVWEDHVGDTARTQLAGLQAEGDGEDFLLPLVGYRFITVMRFNLHKPVSYPARITHHTRKPDRDNLEKAVLDGLVKGRIISDDNAVTDGYSCKRYVTPGHPEGVEIDLTALPVED